MKVATLKIILQSDMCCGTGTGDGVRFDILSAYDEYGLPYIPAKRLKGLLREQMEFLSNCGYLNWSKIDTLFGNGSQAGSITVSNAHIQNADPIKRALNQYFLKDGTIYTPSTVQNVYTVARHATAIEKGVAKDKSLRTFGAVPKGTIFQAQISYPPDAERNIARAVGLLNQIGLSRTRGFGEVVCSLENVPDASNQNLDKAGNYTTNKLVYKITLETDMVSDKDYIAGTALQGWFAGRIPQEQIQDLLTKVRFGNAYPFVEGQIYYPLPHSFITAKNETRLSSQADGFQRVAGTQYVKKSGYVWLDRNKKEYREYRVQKGISYHVTTKGQNDLFTLPILKAGQTFAGHIYVDDTALWQQLLPIVSEHSQQIRLGASSGIQFGQCRLEFSSPEISNQSIQNDETDWVVTFLSDTVLYDEKGLNTLNLDTLKDCVLELFTGGKIEESGIYTATELTGGYNGKWKMPRRRYYAFAKGTQVCVSGGSPIQKEGFIGFLQEEGYGQYRIEPRGVESYSLQDGTCDSTTASDTNGEDSPEVRSIVKAIHRNHLLQKLEVGAYQLFSSESTILNGISSSSMLRLTGLYQTLQADKTNDSLCKQSIVNFYSHDREQSNYPTREELVCQQIVTTFESICGDNEKFVDSEENYFLHYFQYILTAIKLWYKGKKDDE